MTRPSLPLLALLALALAGCATLTPTVGSIDEPTVQLVQRTPFVSTWRAPDFHGTPLPHITDVRIAPALARTLPPSERTALEQALAQALDEAFPRPASRGDGGPTYRLEATIIGADASNPALNRALALLVGPVDTGGAHVRFHLYADGQAAPVSVVEVARNGRVLSRKGFQRWGHATQAFTFAVDALAAYVDDPAGFEAGKDRS